MEILVKEPSAQDAEVVLLFGLGMIGSDIREGLAKWQFHRARQIPFDWRDAESRARACALVQRFCQDLARPPSRISTVWSAGRTNFFSTDQEVAEENRSFEQVLKLTENMKRIPGATAISFHYVSSAGGLFEGQRLVDRTTTPSPMRPYGHMKLNQEHQLSHALDAGEIRIYRPSSVYGAVAHPRKHGLINHLIADASKHRVSVLDANVMALRDYVYAGDIGNYIARFIAHPGEAGGSVPVDFLVSGRCASIFEVVAHIERITHLRVQYRFDRQFGNSADITFKHTVLPAGWRPSTLDVGIRRFLLRDMPQTRGAPAAILG